MAPQTPRTLDFPHCLSTFPAPSFPHTYQLRSLKFQLLLSLPLVFLTACSDLNPKEKDKPKAKNTTQIASGPPLTEQPLPEQAADRINFSDPDTSGALLTEDEKKTVTGPDPTSKPVEGDNVIKVTPPLPKPTLPDE
ncbi:MAG TPA: hypothetical protein DDW68_00530 [Verrucomicrobiales bacterium]|nr:hypothetical protein [Verrucomicrobiales bacterium]